MFTIDTKYNLSVFSCSLAKSLPSWRVFSGWTLALNIVIVGSATTAAVYDGRDLEAGINVYTLYDLTNCERFMFLI